MVDVKVFPDQYYKKRAREINMENIRDGVDMSVLLDTCAGWSFSCPKRTDLSCSFSLSPCINIVATIIV